MTAKRQARLRAQDAPAITVRTRDDLDAVRSSILRLAERFQPLEARGVDANFVIEIRGSRPYRIHIRDGHCSVSAGDVATPDARIIAAPQAWADLVSGRVDGVAAFSRELLHVEGDLNLALRMQTMFRPGPETTRSMRTHRSNSRGVTIDALVAGVGEPVLLLHGLGASKVSFLPTIDALADHHEVHALDLPGFGKSDRPLPHGRRYSPRWMAAHVHNYMALNNIKSAHLVGNSMGGRIATELGLRHPHSVRSVTNLCASVAFDEYRAIAPALRKTQGQWVGLAPFPVKDRWIESFLRELFHDPNHLNKVNMAAAAAEVQRDLRDRSYRLALTAAARHLAVERTRGRSNYWKTLTTLRPPSYWIWGVSDPLVNSRYAESVRDALPHARNEVWDQMGHVPQYEDPDRTNAAILDFITDVEARR